MKCNRIKKPCGRYMYDAASNRCMYFSDSFDDSFGECRAFLDSEIKEEADKDQMPKVR